MSNMKFILAHIIRLLCPYLFGHEPTLFIGYGLAGRHTAPQCIIFLMKQ